LGQLFATVVEDKTNEYSDETREFVYKQFGTCLRAFLTIFEVTMVPGGFIAYRFLYDEIHPFVSLFFLFYNMIVTFAVVRVISALFLKATLAAGSADEEHMAQEKEIARIKYVEILKNVVAQDHLRGRQKGMIVDDGNGSPESGQKSYTSAEGGAFDEPEESTESMVTQEELFQLLKLPRMHDWLTDKEVALGEHETQWLYKALSREDGRISFSDFVDALLKMRGPARAAEVQLTLQETARVLDELKDMERTQDVMKGKMSAMSASFMV
jgi:hypothetical protein